MDEPKKVVVNYVDKKKFYDALVDYKAACAASPDNIPRVPEYIGSCYIKIANGVMRRPNFSQYSWRDEMVSDAIEICLKYTKTFDPSKSDNPFGYFSRACWNAAVVRIKQENRQSKIKRDLISSADFETYTLQAIDEGDEFVIDLNEFLTSIGTDSTPVEITNEVEQPGGLSEFTE